MSKHEFRCEICQYKTAVFGSYNKHLKTKKHIQNEKQEYISPCYKYMCKCSKGYNSYDSFYYHKKHCTVHNDTPPHKDEQTDTLQTQLGEIIQLLLEQRDKPTVHIENNTIINNNFTVNVILNEKFQTADTIEDMVKSFPLTMEYFGKITSKYNRYAELNGEMANKYLNKTPIEKRPIHCIKDKIYTHVNNKWREETQFQIFKNLVRETSGISGKRDGIANIIDFLKQNNKEKIKSIYDKESTQLKITTVYDQHISNHEFLNFQIITAILDRCKNDESLSRALIVNV
jgi:hypothetical protein